MKATNKIFTVDVEDYYHAENVWTSLSKQQRGSVKSRVDIGTEKILDLLAQSGNKATFFVLGCIAEGNKELIKKISDEGHEIATHGYLHKPLWKHTSETFEAGLEKSLKILFDITGQKIIGYRAPSFSLSKVTNWVFDILEKHGIVYDSSISPSLFRSTFKNIKRAPFCFKISKAIQEFPITCFRKGSLEIPMGGGYFRMLPYRITKMGLNSKGRREGDPVIFYIHPWELDSQQPRIKMSYVKAVRHYGNINNTEQKLKRLLNEEHFVSIKAFIKNTKLIEDRI